MIQGFEDILVESIKMNFLVADTGVKHSFFYSIEMALINTIHHGQMDKRIHNSLQLWTESEVLTNKLAEEVCKHPRFSRRLLRVTSTNEVEKALVRNESTVKSKTQVELPSMGPKD